MSSRMLWLCKNNTIWFFKKLNCIDYIYKSQTKLFFKKKKWYLHLLPFVVFYSGLKKKKKPFNTIKQIYTATSEVIPVNKPMDITVQII